MTHTVYAPGRGLESELRSRAAVDDSTLVTLLQSRAITRLAVTESVGVFGLVLYIMNGERFDLYAFNLVAFANMLLIRPKREDWEAAFRSQSMIYPTISSSPW